VPPEPSPRTFVTGSCRCAARWTLLALVLFAPVSVYAQASPRTAAEMRVAASLDQALSLPVSLRATVTYVDALRNLVFVDDGTAGMVVVPVGEVEAVPGDVVRVEGQLLVGARGPSIAVSEIEVIGRAPEGPPRPLVWSDVRAGTLDARLVVVRGVVRRAEPRGEDTHVTIRTAGGALEADLAGEVPFEVDAVVEVRGMLVPPEGEPQSATRQLLGAAAAARVVEPPVPAGQAPHLGIAALPRESARGTLTRRVAITGVVTRQRPGRSLYLRDDTGAVYVETDLLDILEVGDRVEATGYPAVDEFAPYLEDAVFRRLGPGPAPTPRSATLPELLSGSLDAELVVTEAVLVTGERGREEHTFVLQSDDLLFNAHVLLTRAGTLADDLRPGSRLRVTGIASVVVDADRVPRSFRLLLRDAGDVVVLAGPPFGGGGLTWPGWLAVAIALAAIGGLGYAYHRSQGQDRRLQRALDREAALKVRLADLFDHATDIMVLHDRRGRIASLNRAGEQATGYTRDELRVLDPAWLLSSDYLDTIERMLREGADALPRTFRADLVTRRGEKVPVEARARVLSSDGAVTGVETLARNTSEREHLEAQLRQAQKMEAVGRLSTGVAHDFNNLITVLLGYSDDLIEGLGPGHPLRQSAEEIRLAAERASSLTQQLLTFSRRQASVTQSIDLNVTIANMRALLQRLAGEDVAIEVAPERDLGLIRADAAQIGQVLMNLVVNARDAMPSGGRITITTANVELGDEHLDAVPGPHVQLTVTDTGAGIPPEVRLRMFEPFFTTKAAEQGTGLGLAMVQGIVLQSNGHIAVESEPGQGATFRLLFPRVDADETVHPAHSPGPRERSTAARTPASGVVLLAEDDRAVRRLLGNELRRRGFTVLEARHGGEALEICRQYGAGIDLLITDVVMPQMGGVDLAAAVAPIRPEMAVLFVSGHPDRAGASLDPRGPNAGNLLMKPFSPETLGLRAQEILRGRR